MTDTPSSRDVLDAFRVPTKPNWYTIGYGESRVTLYSQQVRALNLAWALVDTGQVVPKTRVVVIGGGAAGLSVAAGLACKETDVTVLEKERDLLPLQRNCHKRHLHPHVFDWPEPTADNTRADLPLLDWGAGVACDVALEMEDGFDELCSRHASLRAHCGIENIQLDCPLRGKVTCRLAAENRIETLSYDVLIFALGFGMENSVLTGRRGSYWADDSLDQHGVMPSGDYLVSGSGDGALIDVFRLLLPELTQPGLVRLLRAGISNEDEFTEWIKGVEREAMEIGSCVGECGIHQQGDFLFRKYATFEPETFGAKHLHETIGGELNARARVTLLTKDASPFSLRTRPLHRFILSQLHFGFSQYLIVRCNTELKRGELTFNETHVLYQPKDAAGEQFEHAVIRHGS